AAADDHRRAGDLDPLDVVPGAVGAGVEDGRPAELLALADDDLLAEPDPPVAAEVDRERAGGGARGRVLGNAVGRGGHPRLPARARAGEAVGAYWRADLCQRRHVGAQRRNRLLALELDVDVEGAVLVGLDREARALDPDRGQQLGVELERRPG